jgi:hypothetical protein
MQKDVKICFQGGAEDICYDSVDAKVKIGF